MVAKLELLLGTPVGTNALTTWLLLGEVMFCRRYGCVSMVVTKSTSSDPENGLQNNAFCLDLSDNKCYP